MSRLHRRAVLAGAAAALAPLPAVARRDPVVVSIDTPLPAPRWAVLQRELLAANTAACEAFYDKYVDARDWLLVTERWGANDGPDDAAEATNDWELLHALGGGERVLTLARRFWEGHLKQYAAARTVAVPIARLGMYHREFPVQMDWQHNAEGLTSFNLQGLSTPRDRAMIVRTRRFADFYTGRDRTAPNYDPRHRVMRSMMNGSRGPMLRSATALDWAGDPFDPTAFRLEHGERSYQETLDHYADYGDVVGDNPLNLQATTLGLNAYALGAGERFRRWALDYLDAWVERARDNGGILPSKVGADGRVGADWWQGVYGWGFSPVVPQTGVRENRNRVFRSITAFMNGTLLTGDSAYIELWRRQRAKLESLARTIGGKRQVPTMCGADGWYGWTPAPDRTNGFEIWYVTQDPADRAAAGDHPWLTFLEGRDPAWPETALNADLARVVARRRACAEDATTKATRLADWILDKNPASVASLVAQTTGGLHIARPPWSKTSPPQGGVTLHCRLRWFDRDARRAGLPEDVAALVTALGDRSAMVSVVNTGPRARTVVLQGGAYAEHRIERVSIAGRSRDVAGPHLTLRLAPGAGAQLELAMTRYANRPTLAFPWDR